MKRYFCDLCGQRAPARSEAFEHNDVNQNLIEHRGFRIRIFIDRGEGSKRKDLCRTCLQEAIGSGKDQMAHRDEAR